MGNANLTINKNKKNKKVICYISLVFLVILLFLPAALRMLVDEKEEVKQEAITILNCNRSNETINATFLGSQPHSIKYTITGNYLALNGIKEETKVASGEINNPDEDSSVVSSSDNNNSYVYNDMIEKIKDYSDITYDEASDTTSFKVRFDSFKTTSYYELNFNTIVNQETYYRSQDFSCTKTVE